MVDRNPTVSKDALEGLLGLPFDMVNAWCDKGLISSSGIDMSGF